MIRIIEDIIGIINVNRNNALNCKGIMRIIKEIRWEESLGIIRA